LALGTLAAGGVGGCLDGVNAHGLTVALLADDETMSTHPMEPAGQAGVGLNEINVLRMLLDTCADVDEAREGGLSSGERKELVVLRHKQRLETENEILRRAAAPFARDGIVSKMIYSRRGQRPAGTGHAPSLF
jgi:hypothetical protein